MGKKKAKAAARQQPQPQKKRPQQQQQQQQQKRAHAHRPPVATIAKKPLTGANASSSSSKEATPRCPYSAGHSTLLLGEGDFSFAAALCCLWGDATKLYATAFDGEADASAKYSSLADNVETVRSFGGTALFGIDAMRCHTHGVLRRVAFDRIIFNFPHAGAGIKDQARNIATNQALLCGTNTHLKTNPTPDPDPRPRPNTSSA